MEDRVSVIQGEFPSVIDHYFLSRSFSSDSSLEGPRLVAQSRDHSRADQFVASVISWTSQYTVSDQCVPDLFALIVRELRYVCEATELSSSQFAAKILLI